jgi:hypothetical protein
MTETTPDARYNLNADRLVSAAADAHSAVRGRFK